MARPGERGHPWRREARKREADHQHLSGGDAAAATPAVGGWRLLESFGGVAAPGPSGKTGRGSLRAGAMEAAFAAFLRGGKSAYRAVDRRRSSVSRKRGELTGTPGSRLESLGSRESERMPGAETAGWFSREIENAPCLGAA